MFDELRVSAAWITWEIQTRNRSISSLLNIPLYELISKKPRFIRYFLLSIKTIKIFRRYDVLFVQNPSLALSLLATLIKITSGKVLIVDAHNSGIFPFEGKSRILNYITIFICKNADRVIVTNRFLADIVTSWGGRAIVMPDPIPNINPNYFDNFEKCNHILFICTWSSDEPYKEVIEAARLISPEIKLLITGNYKKANIDLSNIPPNVILLGFVDEDKYINYLGGALLAIDLTTRDNCLVCGAYEAAALATPCIVSDTEVNRKIFSQGFVHTKNDSKSIADSLVKGLHNLENLTMDIKKFKKSHTDMTDFIIREIKELIFSFKVKK